VAVVITVIGMVIRHVDLLALGTGPVRSQSVHPADGSSWTAEQLAIAMPRSRFSSIKPVAALAGNPYPIFAGTVQKLRWNIFKPREARRRGPLQRVGQREVL
jgi:hypothetical protein